MEEKERYEIDKSTSYYTNTIVDTKTNTYYGNIEEHIDLLNQQDKENKQLKQQLAEKEAERELDNAFWKQECDSLQKALTEKEKAIKTMQESSDKNVDYLIEFTSLIKNQKDCNRMLEALERVKTDKKHQNKISFAIEQLEKVRKSVDEFLDNCKDKQYKVWEVFDNQIKLLKEGK